MITLIKREVKCLLILTTALILIFAGPYASSSHFVYSTSSQGDDSANASDGTINATTECIGFGTDSESAADAQLNSNGTNIVLQCDQVISSNDGNGANIATNTVQVNDIAGDNQVSQKSKQKIGG
ncbi:MAG: hypothetical protein ACRD8Z_11675 [Nitrososphaeraceae archaeon]